MDWKKQLGVEILSLSEATKEIGDTDDFYVYILWKLYTEEPVPFYVGKGHYQRIIKHEMKSEELNNIYKTNIIKKHKKLGLEIGYSIFNLFKDESKALLTEIELISLIGRADLKQGPLTNKTDGGDGTLGHLAPKGGDSNSARPVVANNIEYACLKDAAEELNIEPGSVVGRIKNGWQGYYYVDEGQRPQKENILGRYRKTVVVEGQKFNSASEAARYLDIDVRMISKRINYGWEGYYYTEEGQKERKTVWSNRKDKVAVLINNVKYETIAEAVNATGESMAMISKRCLSSNYQNYQRLDGKVIQKSKPPVVSQGVLIKGQLFESISKAAEVCKLTDGGVTYRCQSENYPDWRFSDSQKQENESFTPEFSSIPVPVKIDGIYYESQSAAAQSHNVDINTLKRRCRSISFPTWLCEGIKKSEPKDGRQGLISIKIDHQVYRSISEASKKTGVARTTIKRRLSSSNWPNYIEN